MITVFEIGSHKCEDTKRIFDMIQPDRMVCIEPVPEHCAAGAIRLREDGLLGKTLLVNGAISNVEGMTTLFEAGASSSILRPTGHLKRFPLIKFNVTSVVPTITLDKLCVDLEITSIDFIHMDVQGAEHLVFEGGQKILETVDYITTEYYDEPMYEGQKSLAELVAMLPGRWEIVKRLENDAVLENMHE